MLGPPFAFLPYSLELLRCGCPISSWGRTSWHPTQFSVALTKWPLRGMQGQMRLVGGQEKSFHLQPDFFFRFILFCHTQGRSVVTTGSEFKNLGA